MYACVLCVYVSVCIYIYTAGHPLAQTPHLAWHGGQKTATSKVLGSSLRATVDVPSMTKLTTTFFGSSGYGTLY